MPFLLSPLFRYGMLALALIAALGGIWLHGRSAGVESMRPKLEAAKSDAENWRVAAENRKTIIEAQNQAVAGLKASNELRVSTLRKQLAVANSEASKFRKIADEKANTLLNMKLSENECQALVQLVDEARK